MTTPTNEPDGTSQPDDAAGSSTAPSFAEWEARWPGSSLEDRDDATAPARDTEQAERQADREAVRLAGRTTALLQAACWSVPFGLVMLASAAMTASNARAHFLQPYTFSAVLPEPPPYLLWLLAIGGTCWAACTAAELLHANKLAGDYPPRGPWARIPASPVIRAARRASAGLTSSTGSGCLGILPLVIIGPAFVIAWSFFTVTSAPLWILAVGAATLVHLTTTL